MPDKRYADQTQDVVLERAKDRVSDDVDKRQGSVVHDLLAPFATEAETIYKELDNVLNAGFVSDEQPRDYLIKRAAEVGLTLLPPEKAEGELTITADDGDVIPAGTRFYAEEDDPIYFVTLEDAEIVGETATVKAEAEMPGAEGNVSAGEIRFVDGDFTGVSDVINNDSFEGGTDEESTEALLRRYYTRVREPSLSGNVSHYKQWATETAGVSAALVEPVWDGAGTVRVLLVSDEMRAPDPQIVDNARENIEKNKPIFGELTVEPVTELEIDVTADVVLREGATISDAEEDLVDKLTDYFADLVNDAEDTVRYARVVNILFTMNDVIDYQSITINGGTDNISYPITEVPVVGSVVLNDVTSA